MFCLHSPPGPGDDNQLASPLDPCEHPLAVSAASGNAVPVGAAELTAARYCPEPCPGAGTVAEALLSPSLDG